MIIDFTSGTGELRQTEYFGISNGFFMPSGEGGVLEINPSIVFTAQKEALIFTAQKEALIFTAQRG